MPSKHLISINDLSIEEINNLLTRAKYWVNNNREELSPARASLIKPIVCNIFFEPSTRTRFSFEVAAKKLDYHVINFDDKISSTQKGETFYDTMKTLESMGVNIAIIRTSEENLLQEMSNKISDMSFVNAGAGANEHPTQGLLDLMTIKQEFKDLVGLKVSIIGDVKHSRVAQSNIMLLNRLGAKIQICGPENLMPEKDPKKYEIVNIEKATQDADVVMVLRVQYERHGITVNEYKEGFGLTEKRAAQMQKHAIIMNPAPFNRRIEIDDEVVESPQSRIFKQVANGVAIRMAVLERAAS